MNPADSYLLKGMVEDVLLIYNNYSGPWKHWLRIYPKGTNMGEDITWKWADEDDIEINEENVMRKIKEKYKL